MKNFNKALITILSLSCLSNLTACDIGKDDPIKFIIQSTGDRYVLDASDNNIEGTGLGLVITKKYVDMMGGKIWFESEYKAGTTFYVELPQKIVDSTPLSDVTELDEDGKITDITICISKQT